jgi:hypothetical protein
MRSLTVSLGRLVVAGLAVTAFTACSGSVSVGGANAVAKDKVEAQTAEQLAAKLNQPKPTITCPDDLKAEVGATLDCTLVAQGDTTKLPVHLEVDSVKDGDVHWQISVGNAPGSDGTPTTKAP